MSAEKTLDRCHCGEPLYEKVKASGEGVYQACHHCDRGCTADPLTCPQCLASGAFNPYDVPKEKEEK